MWKRFTNLRRDERGMSFVFIGLGFMAFVAASTLAIDVGMFMTARSQAQNAADAGALAGATALAFNSFDDRTTGGPAVQSAVNTALANSVIGASPSTTPADVTFPAGPTGNNRVKVNVFRTGARSNPIPTLIGPLFGVPTVNIDATATAEASPANAMTCVKPFTIPDKWQENKTPPWNSDTSTFDRYDNKGNVVANADVYIPAGQAGYTGYNPTRDKGTRLAIRAGNGQNVAPSMYFSWAMPSNTGGDDYRGNIANCNTTLVHFGDPEVQEPGNMEGPTTQGIDDLIAKDPNAYWDTAKNEVHTSMSPSPRVFPIPLYDPDYYQFQKTNGRNATLRVANWIGFFVENRNGNEVVGRITPILGVIDNNAGPAPTGVFPVAIRLVQ
ncbi:MAG TPA: pilus assembly protein TadG-related protein [Vicinamibacterales bacterium]|jgi:Flp pilus assembly protein TadG|nr:pilus assembly protein TadG-related protein [Vicinamibacterales bacterium]